MKGKGRMVTHYILWRETEQFPDLKVPRQCPLVLLVELKAFMFM
jgi:hypothetical protein